MRFEMHIDAVGIVVAILVVFSLLQRSAAGTLRCTFFVYFRVQVVQYPETVHGLRAHYRRNSVFRVGGASKEWGRGLHSGTFTPSKSEIG